jgi:hypothetical protein
MAKRLFDIVQDLESAFGPGEFITEQEGEEEGAKYDSFSETFHLCRYDLHAGNSGERLLRDILIDLATLSSTNESKFCVNLGMLVDVWIEPAILTRRGVRIRDVQKVGGRDLVQLLESFSGKRRKVLGNWADLAAQELQLNGGNYEEEVAYLRELSEWMYSTV